MEALIAQMKQNNTKEIVYRFGRTAPDKEGKNIIMFFNVGYDENQLNNIAKIKVVKLCPTNCNANVDNYLK